MDEPLHPGQACKSGTRVATQYENISLKQVQLLPVALPEACVTWFILSVLTQKEFWQGIALDVGGCHALVYSNTPWPW